MKEEARLAKEHMIPEALRGPPDGPGPGPPWLWRGMTWKEDTREWVKRAGKRLEGRNEYYGKRKGKGKGKNKGDAKSTRAVIEQ